MEFDAPSKLAKIISVLGDKNPVLCDGSVKHDTIGRAQSRPIARMDRIVQSVPVEMMAERWGNALVDEEFHAGAFRPDIAGRPTCGWVSA